jgi:hypothetical protein
MEWWERKVAELPYLEDPLYKSLDKLKSRDMMCLCLYAYVYLSIYLSIYLPVCPFFHLSVCPYIIYIVSCRPLENTVKWANIQQPLLSNGLVNRLVSTAMRERRQTSQCCDGSPLALPMGDGFISFSVRKILPLVLSVPSRGCWSTVTYRLQQHPLPFPPVVRHSTALRNLQKSLNKDKKMVPLQCLIAFVSHSLGLRFERARYHTRGHPKFVQVNANATPLKWSQHFHSHLAEELQQTNKL